VDLLQTQQRAVSAWGVPQWGQHHIAIDDECIPPLGAGSGRITDDQIHAAARRHLGSRKRVLCAHQPAVEFGTRAGKDGVQHESDRLDLPARGEQVLTQVVADDDGRCLRTRAG